MMTAALDRWGVAQGSHTLLIVDEATDALRLSARNVPTLKLAAASGLNVYDILRADNIIIEAAALKYIQVHTHPPGRVNVHTGIVHAHTHRSCNV